MVALPAHRVYPPLRLIESEWRTAFAITGSGDAIISFGPFRLSPATRALEKNGVPLTLGHRSLDILIVLTERPGQIVSQRELISRVWRDLVVSPGNLRVHMTALRKVLG